MPPYHQPLVRSGVASASRQLLSWPPQPAAPPIACVCFGAPPPCSAHRQVVGHQHRSSPASWPCCAAGRRPHTYLELSLEQLDSIIALSQFDLVLLVHTLERLLVVERHGFEIGLECCDALLHLLAASTSALQLLPNGARIGRHVLVLLVRHRTLLERRDGLPTCVRQHRSESVEHTLSDAQAPRRTRSPSS